MAKAQDLINVLAAKSRFEPVDVDEKPTQIRILGRVRTDGSPSSMENWLLMMLAIAKREELGAAWKIDISRKYFPRGGKLIFAWRLIIQGENLEEQLNEIMAAAKGSPTSNRANLEITEMSLQGSSGDRNAMKNGRGAGLSGKVPAGPAAIHNHRNGGG